MLGIIRLDVSPASALACLQCPPLVLSSLCCVWPKIIAGLWCETDTGLSCRQMFANAELARAAAEKEIQEARARTAAQRELADAQAQAAQRTLVVAREKAGNEAKSLFMSLMMHEVCPCPADPSLLQEISISM